MGRTAMFDALRPFAPGGKLKPEWIPDIVAVGEPHRRIKQPHNKLEPQQKYSRIQHCPLRGVEYSRQQRRASNHDSS